MWPLAKELLVERKLDKSYWGKKIIAAEKRGGFTDSNVREAENWVTCACGKALPKEHCTANGTPLDYEMNRLGKLFESHVRFDLFLRAAHILCGIEERAKRIQAGA